MTRSAATGRAPVRVRVLGTGAVASLVGARLARSGAAEVTLVGTWAEALSALRSDGVTVEEPRETWTVPVAAARLGEALGPADLVLVAVKSHRTAAVATAAAASLEPDGLVVTLQNGLGNLEILEAAAGRGHTATGVSRLGASMVGPARVRSVGVGEILLGSHHAPQGRLERAAQLLTLSGTPTQVCTDVDRVVWQKLVANCAINPLSALRGLPNGALLLDPEARPMLEAAALEVGAVAAARGIDLQADPVALTVAVAEATAANRSSMLQDRDRSFPTEIDALCGAIVAEGKRLGVPTPVNRWLWDEVRTRETGATTSMSSLALLAP